MTAAALRWSVAPIDGSLTGKCYALFCSNSSVYGGLLKLALHDSNSSFNQLHSCVFCRQTIIYLCLSHCHSTNFSLALNKLFSSDNVVSNGCTWLMLIQICHCSCTYVLFDDLYCVVMMA
jgi:hypothetical protein